MCMRTHNDKQRKKKSLKKTTDRAPFAPAAGSPRGRLFAQATSQWPRRFDAKKRKKKEREKKEASSPWGLPMRVCFSPLFLFVFVTKKKKKRTHAMLAPIDRPYSAGRFCSSLANSQSTMARVGRGGGNGTGASQRRTRSAIDEGIKSWSMSTTKRPIAASANLDRLHLQQNNVISLFAHPPYVRTGPRSAPATAPYPTNCVGCVRLSARGRISLSFLFAVLCFCPVDLNFAHPGSDAVGCGSRLAVDYPRGRHRHSRGRRTSPVRLACQEKKAARAAAAEWPQAPAKPTAPLDQRTEATGSHTLFLFCFVFAKKKRRDKAWARMGEEEARPA